MNSILAARCCRRFNETFPTLKVQTSSGLLLSFPNRCTSRYEIIFKTSFCRGWNRFLQIRLRSWKPIRALSKPIWWG